jgi:hypothetical protein
VGAHGTAWVVKETEERYAVDGVPSRHKVHAPSSLRCKHEYKDTGRVVVTSWHDTTREHVCKAATVCGQKAATVCGLQAGTQRTWALRQMRAVTTGAWCSSYLYENHCGCQCVGQQHSRVLQQGTPAIKWSMLIVGSSGGREVQSKCFLFLLHTQLGGTRPLCMHTACTARGKVRGAMLSHSRRALSAAHREAQ